MTAERREAAAPDQAGGAENPPTVSQRTTDFTPDPAAGPPGPAPALPAAFGRYQVRGTLGAGGFGTVYLGHDTQLDRPVALKVLRAGASPARAAGEPALREARRLAQLRHPGIVAVHDVGVQEGQVYIVSDYLDGPDLGRWLREHRSAWPAAARIAAAVADALAHAHARLIIHRDVKPANILLTAERAPVLVDFGLALRETQAGGAEKGVVAGTPAYMSPEQAAGTAHRIDGRTDIYSLGVVLYEMLTGRLPFRATQLRELLRQVREDQPQPPRQLVGDIPPDLGRACLKALAKRQEDRYTTAGDFAADLRRVLPPSSGAELTAPHLGWLASPPISPVQRHTVGRQKERAELRRAFESAAAGQGLFLCVTGEPGIGKTTSGGPGCAQPAEAVSPMGTQPGMLATWDRIRPPSVREAPYDPPGRDRRPDPPCRRFARTRGRTAGDSPPSGQAA